MGYDAYVSCNCYKEGKTTEPPYKGYIKIDNEGVQIDIPDSVCDDEWHKMYHKLSDWQCSACVHKDMKVVSCRIANSGGMIHFRTLLYNLGGEKVFPVLTEYLPVANGGFLPTEHAQKALDEVLFIYSNTELEDCIFLRDKESQRVEASSNDMNFHYTFGWSGQYRYCLDKNGFFIYREYKESEKDRSEIVFRSSHFTQKRYSPWHRNIFSKSAKKEKDIYRLTDKEGYAVFDSSLGLGDNKENRIIEFEVSIEQRRIAEGYEYITKPLIELLKASITTGNHVIWW